MNDRVTWWRTSFGWLAFGGAESPAAPQDLLDDVLRTALSSGARSWVVGFDHRRGAAEWARSLAERLAGPGKEVVLAAKPCPLSGVSLPLEKGEAEAGLVVTGLSEPVSYTGVVLLQDNSSAPRADGHVAAVSRGRVEAAAGTRANAIRESDFCHALLDSYRAVVHRRDLRRAQMQALIDANGGVTDRLLEQVLRDSAARVATIYGLPLSTFYNRPVLPQPGDLFELSLQVERGKWNLGLALSGGGDCLSVVDENGRPVDLGDLQLLLLDSVLRDDGPDALLLAEPVTRRAEDLARDAGVSTRRVHGDVWDVSRSLDRSGGTVGLGEFGQVLTADFPVPDAMFSALQLLNALGGRNARLSTWVDELRDRYGRSSLCWRDLDGKSNLDQVLTAASEVRVPGLGQAARTWLDQNEFGEIQAKWEVPETGAWVWLKRRANRVRLFAEATDSEAAQALLEAFESGLFERSA